MERVIKFRGFDLEKQCWRYGNLLEGVDEGKVHKLIQEGAGSAYVVDPKSIGQFIGMLDKNGAEVFEQHLVHWPHLGNQLYEVYYNATEETFTMISGSI